MRRHLPWLVLAAVLLAYLPSLAGGWVWDDHFLLESSPALAHPLRYLTLDIWAASGEAPSSLYRPLVMFTYVPGAFLGWGPHGERLINLALHLLAVALVATLAGHGHGRKDGPGPTQAAEGDPTWPWLAAAIFGLHPAVSEPVAWLTGRHDLLPAVLFLAGWSAWSGGRAWPGGLLLALTPFCKETWLLAPLAAMVLMLGARRFSPGFLLPALLGSAAYLAVRQHIGLPLPVGAALTQTIAASGALTIRGLELLFLPHHADAMALFTPNLAAGGLALTLGAVLLLAAWGRPALAALAATLVMVLPAAPASAQIGLVADRYFYVLVAGAMVALGCLAIRRQPLLGWRLALALAVLPLVLGLLTARRALDWRNDASLFQASLARNPANPHAAFHMAHDLQTRQDDCQAAIPLYRQALLVEPRAGNNLQACLVQQGLLTEAAAMGPGLAQQGPTNPNPAANTARALALLGDLPGAEGWIREAIARDQNASGITGLGLPLPDKQVEHWILLANILGMQGRLDEAGSAFLQALQLDPNERVAIDGLAMVEERRREAAEAAPQPPG